MIKVFRPIFLTSLIAILVAISFPIRQAQAQFVVEFGPAATSLVTGILTATSTTAVSTTSTAVVSGIPGVGASTVNSLRASLGAPCIAILTALRAENAVSTFLDTTSTSALSVIGGSPFEFTKINAKLAKATSAKVCVDTYVEALSGVPGVTFEISNEVAREQDKYTKVGSALSLEIQNLGAQQNSSAKDIMKAFMVKLVLNLNKNLTTKVVNELQKEYKIDDYLAYGDALATQVYAMKYIDQNYEGDARTQMMMRSLIQSEKVPQQARVASAFANQQAKEYVASQCGNVGELDATNGASLNCLASYGNEQASPMFKYLNALDTSAKIRAEAQKTAQAEIAQSDGYAPPRNCGGSVQQQTQIDAQISSVTAERDAALAVVIRMTDALAAGQTNEAEFAKAQAAYEAAEQKFANLPNQVSDPVIDICEAISSPAKFVSTSIENYLNQHLDQGSKLQSENLPFYATFLADLTSNFLTNLLTGGKSGTKILKEAGTSALGLGIASVPAIIGNSGSGGGQEFGDQWVGVYMTAVGSNNKITDVRPGQQYTFNIDLTGHVQAGRELPNRIVIRDRDSGEAIINQSLSNLSANTILKYNFTAESRTVRWEVELSVRDGDGARILSTVTGAYFVQGQVSGVVTTNFNPRGEARQPLQIR